MKYFTYVIYSKMYNRFYKGQCQDIVARLKQHNKGYTKSTSPYTPWEIIWHEEFNTREEAIKREKYLKTAAGRRFIKKIISI